MKRTELIKLNELLDLADQQASASAYNLNTLDMKQPVSKSIQNAIDKEASGIKGAINHILNAKAILKEALEPQKNEQFVYIWFVIDEGAQYEKDFVTDSFIWPFQSLPNAGDKLETYNFIQSFAPGLPAEFLEYDYFEMQYSFFEKNEEGFSICLKLIGS